VARRTASSVPPLLVRALARNLSKIFTVGANPHHTPACCAKELIQQADFPAVGAKIEFARSVSLSKFFTLS